MNNLSFFKNTSYLQSTAVECGLACLGYVAAHYGADHEMSELRGRFVVSIRGTTLMDLIRIGSELGFTCRPLRLEMDEIQQLKLPCILHWQLDHFVVLKQIKGERIVIHDPSKGERLLRLSEVSRCFTGIALELTPAPAFEFAEPPRRVPVSHLIGRVSGLARSLTQIGVLAVALQIFVLLTPIIVQWIVDSAIVSGDRDFLLVLGIAYALVAILKIGLEAVRGWLAIVLSTQFSLQWSGRLIGHLLRLPMQWFEVRHTGDVVSRFQSMGSIQQVITGKLVEVVLDGFFGLIVLLVMLLYSVKLSLCVIAAILAYLLIRTVPHGIYHRLSDEALVHEAKAQSHFLESIRAVHTTKLAGLENQRRARWLNLFVAGVNKRVSAQKMTLGFSVGYGVVATAQSLAVLGLGALMIMDNLLTIGMLMAFISYKDDFVGRMQRLIDNVMSMRMMRLHVDRLSDIVLVDQEDLGTPVLEGTGAVTDAVISPVVELENISFRYGESAPWVLRHVTMLIAPGEHVAIVGASGCGKSTLVKLLLGLLEPTEGLIKINGVPLIQYGVAKWRSQVGAVMQNDQLFSGSLMDNIVAFDTQIDTERLERSCHLAAIEKEIRSMPMGYGTHVGDMGSSLSGGQLQRVLMARALYKRPAVLVLDEATSHLDVQNEKNINESISSLSISRITIAHRPETIAMADRVISIINGQTDANIKRPISHFEIESVMC